MFDISAILLDYTFPTSSPFTDSAVNERLSTHTIRPPLEDTIPI